MKSTNLLLFSIIILCSFTSVKEIPPYKNTALSKQVKHIALIGQDAAQARLGGYSGPGVDKVCVLDGLKNKLGDQAGRLPSDARALL